MGYIVLAGTYFLLLIVGGAYFLFRHRSFDLFAVAFGGAAFYFSPLLIGSVPDWNGEDPFAADVPLSIGVYVVGLIFTSATIAGAAIYDSFASETKLSPTPSSSLSNWYIGLAIVGFVGAAASGNLWDLNKTFILTQIGYWFVLFESATALAWVDALLYRRRPQLIAANALLVVDLAIGFRSMALMCFLVYILIKLGRLGKTQLWRSIPYVALATTIAFLFLLIVNNVREIVLPNFGVKYTELSPEQIRAIFGAEPGALRRIPKWHPVKATSVGELVSDLTSRVPQLMWQMEPFVTQAILSETTRHQFSCEVPQIRNIALLAPFIGVRLVGPPISFESQFKPALFPKNWSGMAGNTWAEAYCDFGYIGVVAKVVIFVLAIGGLQYLLARVTSSATPAVLLSGAFLAFYIHRNDLFYELLLIRRILMVFVFAFAANWLFRHARDKLALSV